MLVQMSYNHESGCPSRCYKTDVQLLCHCCKLETHKVLTSVEVENGDPRSLSEGERNSDLVAEVPYSS